MTHRDFFKEAFKEWLGLAEPKRGQLLDVGCRDHALKEFFEGVGFKWTGVDKEPAKGDKGIVTGVMENLEPFRDEMFDLVVCCHSFEHCERPVDALREFQRILKPGGWLFLALPPANKHHILDSDEDHIMVFTEMQLLRLLKYTLYEEPKAWSNEEKHEDNWTVCATGRKP